MCHLGMAHMCRQGICAIKKILALKRLIGKILNRSAAHI
jgi:hypothetical protein